MTGGAITNGGFHVKRSGLNLRWATGVTWLGEIANEFSTRLANGESPSIEEYAHKYPQIAQMIREVFPALSLLKDNSTNMNGDPQLATASSLPGPEPLGDFHILREIGRGGMGVVYEAEQLSMGRKVALKVLPFAAMVDAKMLQRFKNEVRAAATLEHPNIVTFTRWASRSTSCSRYGLRWTVPIASSCYDRSLSRTRRSYARLIARSRLSYRQSC